jgi:hypothetical protein
MPSKLVFAAATFLAVSSTCAMAQDVRHDLNGQWQAEYKLLGPKGLSGPPMVAIERVLITHSNDKILGIKITSDAADPVPAGEETIRGTYDGNPFTAEMQCAGWGFVNPHWHKMTVTVIDQSHLSVDGVGSGCWWPSPPAIWTRFSQTIALGATADLPRTSGAGASVADAPDPLGVACPACRRQGRWPLRQAVND